MNAYKFFLLHSRGTWEEHGFSSVAVKSSQLDKLVLLRVAESISQHTE